MSKRRKSDLSISMYKTDEHPMLLMQRYILKAESVASVPMADAWWLFGAEWEGELPDCFYEEDFDRSINLYFHPGKFTEGINGTSKDLPDYFFKKDPK